MPVCNRNTSARGILGYCVCLLLSLMEQLQIQQHNESNNKLTRTNCTIPAQPGGAKTALASLFPLIFLNLFLKSAPSSKTICMRESQEWSTARVTYSGPLPAASAPLQSTFEDKPGDGGGMSQWCMWFILANKSRSRCRPAHLRSATLWTCYTAKVGASATRFQVSWGWC